jgi:porin
LRRPGSHSRFGRLAGLAGGPDDPETRPDDWALWYNFDQYVYTEKDDPTQGIGLFGRFGWSTGKSNPIEAFYSIGVGGKGILPERDNDTFGVGYYFTDISDNLPAILNVSAEQGVELYYNIEITPWLHIAPDLQVIVDPGGGFGDRDTAIVYGMRAQMSF